jgi:MscS family membrane protein
LLRKILRLVVVLVVVLFVLTWWGHPPTSVLGALGIGGLALAFAAKDTLGNFFGSITVLFDRPFGIGDWIVIGDVEGTVERVGFRSTRVRTFYNSMVTLPNSYIVNTQVDNYGARQYRRARIMLSVAYSTPPEKIDAFCEGIRELIRLHPYTRKDYYHVYFNKFAASSLDILLYTFFEVPDWGTELRERHRLFVDILTLAKKLGVEFAFPTQTVWLERSRGSAGATGGVQTLSGRVDPDAMGIEEASKVFDAAYGDYPQERNPVVIHQTPQSQQGKQSDT